MTTDTMVIELKSVTYDLISLLERETEGLRDLDQAEYERFISEKSALSMQYEQLVLELRERAEDLQNLPDEDKDELRDLQGRFQEAAQRNMTALKAAQSTNQRMIDVIVRAVKSKAEDNVTTYNRNGRANGGSIANTTGKKAKNTLSISLNETL
jgi:flagellar biosynthesis/type III secretory pathway chaperone